MALDFPANPTNGQVYGNYYYDASIGAWNSFSSIGNVIPSTLKNLTLTTDDVGVAPFTVKNSGGTTVASIDNSGTLSATSLTLTNDLTVANGGTGASTFTSGAYLKGNGISAIQAQTGVPFADVTMQFISAAADLNTYTTQGLYHQNNNANAAGGANYPVPYAGFLEVFTADRGNFIYQRYTVYQQQYAVWARARYVTTWGAWQQVPTGTVTVAEGGTGATTVAEAQDTLGIGLVPIIPPTISLSGASGVSNSLIEVPFTAVSSIQLRDLFSSSYTAYKIFIKITSGSVDAAGLFMQLVVGTTNLSTSYQYGGILSPIAGTASSAWAGNNVSAVNLGGIDIARTTSQYEVSIMSPNQPRNTVYNFNGLHWNGSSTSGLSASGWHNTNDQATGLLLYCGSGTMTGSVVVYGYNV